VTHSRPSMKVLLGGQLDEAAPSGGAAAMSAGPPAPPPQAPSDRVEAFDMPGRPARCSCRVLS
jgi:hypothetical protein